MLQSKRQGLIMRVFCLSLSWALVFSPIVSYAYAPFTRPNVVATSTRTGESVDLSQFLDGSASTADHGNNDCTMLILGTYAADFNAIEYAQRLRYYLPQLEEEGVKKIGLVLNCETAAAEKLVELVDLDTSSSSSVEVMVDPQGEAGKAFGVGKGWQPDNEDMSPFLKLFGMLWGLGAWATLPAVIGGYIGNPFVPQPWIEDALAVGQKKNRWPDNALELDQDTGNIKVNKFSELPYVGSWKRRPLELATLRLQNMLDISIKNWSDLSPTEEALKSGVLTQLGGCVIVDSTGSVVYEWKDPGICAVANFEDILKKLKAQSQ
mmetsp:Transcript_9968/g.21072  ORF Transcript_9968/g.21072 Transcript_9968/m.21072 type:complete len:321 (-) Transcript_9968:340-1302(-)